MKTELESIQEWYRYNSFVRKKYLQLIFSERVSEEERYKSRGTSYPSLVDIFVHVLDAYNWWFVYVYNDNVSQAKELREQRKNAGSARATDGFACGRSARSASSTS